VNKELKNGNFQAKGGIYSSITRPTKFDVKTYYLGKIPKNGKGLFYWYNPLREEENIERIRIFPTKNPHYDDDDPGYIVGEIWVCTDNAVDEVFSNVFE
jgi:hypothetical protein